MTSNAAISLGVRTTTPNRYRGTGSAESSLNEDIVWTMTNGRGEVFLYVLTQAGFHLRELRKCANCSFLRNFSYKCCLVKFLKLDLICANAQPLTAPYKGLCSINKEKSVRTANKVKLWQRSTNMKFTSIGETTWPPLTIWQHTWTKCRRKGGKCLTSRKRQVVLS